MENCKLTQEQITAYGHHLHSEEHAPGTIEKYLRDVNAFARWAEERLVTKELAVEWKKHLLATGHKPVTVNSMLAAVNGLFRFLGWDIRMKFLKIQRQLFRDQSRELSREEYNLLVSTARASCPASKVQPSVAVQAARAVASSVSSAGSGSVSLVPGSSPGAFTANATMRATAF